MSLSRESLELLKGLLGQVQLPASDPEFEQKAAAIVKASRELDEAIGSE